MNEEKKPIKEPREDLKCEHSYEFLKVDHDHYDLYKCTKCGHEKIKRWEFEYYY